MPCYTPPSPPLPAQGDKNILKPKKSLYINRLGAVSRLYMRRRGGAPLHVQLWVFWKHL